MADARRTGPPPEKEAAAQVSGPGQRPDFDNSTSQENTTTGRMAEASSTIDTAQLLRLALAIVPRGELRRYLRGEPAWCRRAGDDTLVPLVLGTLPDQSEIDLLLKAHGRAAARRDHERKIAEEERELRLLARRLKRGRSC